MPASTLSRTAVAALGLATAAALTLSACSTSEDSADGKPSVVASTNVWGSVATAIAGDDANVKSIIADPSTDPHSFESSPTDAAELTDADGGARVEQVFANELDALRANQHNTDPTRRVRFLPYGIAVSALDIAVPPTDTGPTPSSDGPASDGGPASDEPTPGSTS